MRDMPTVAEQLRQAREAKHLTIEQVADTTKIRSDHLRALEEGDFRVFAAPVYIRGFVRTYSTLLKLNVPSVMADLDRELGQDRKFAQDGSSTGEPRGVVDFLTLQLSKVDWRRGGLMVALAVVAVAGVAVYLAWWHYHTKDPLKSLPPGMYHSTQHVSGETLPLPTPAPKR